MVEITNVVLFGKEPVFCPSAGRFCGFVMRPGVHGLHAAHWAALAVSSDKQAAAMHDAIADGRMGPADSTPNPAPPAPAPVVVKAVERTEVEEEDRAVDTEIFVAMKLAELDEEEPKTTKKAPKKKAKKG